MSNIALFNITLYLYDHDVSLNIEEKLCNDKEDIREPPPKVRRKHTALTMKIVHRYYHQ